MHTLLTADENQLIETNSIPAVSIILPFEPKMSLKSDLDQKLKRVFHDVEKELLSSYPKEMAMPVITKLQSVIQKLNYNTHKKSITIFVSPAIEKVYYLDIAVEEKIIVDDSFEIRDIILNKKQNIQYLILMLSGRSSKMYLGNCNKFSLIKSNRSRSMNSFKRDLPQRISHYSDVHHEKEILLNEFLHHMDEDLAIILKAYPLPVFVLGTKKVLGHFGQLTHHASSIIKYVHGNYDRLTEVELRDVIRPHAADWFQVKQQNVLQQLENARNTQSLVYGMQDIWKESSHKNIKLLVVEQDFMYPGSPGIDPENLYKVEMNSRRHFYIKDAVDDVMEKVLSAAGDVEFVANGMLANYERIAAITRINEKETAFPLGNLNLLNN